MSANNNTPKDNVTSLLDRVARETRIRDGKQKHAEAFCLMRYECSGALAAVVDTKEKTVTAGRIPGCGHHEIIWNSRDGVTPFGMACPSCGYDLMHAYFGSDAYAPEHKPHVGQRVWRDGTLAEWEEMWLERLLDQFPSAPRSELEQKASDFARDAVSQGEPWLEVTGYVRKR